MADVPLYARSQLARREAIRQIVDVILRLQIKPRTATRTLQLLRKLLPSDNTLPTTIDELFSAMISTQYNWRLAQYLLRHKRSRPNKSPKTATPCLIKDHDESDTETLSRSSAFALRHSDASISDSDEESEIVPCERLQRCLRPVIGDIYGRRILPTDIRPSPVICSFHPTDPVRAPKRPWCEISLTASANGSDISNKSMIVDDNDDEMNDGTSYTNGKRCCFEMNGCDVLNGGKRRRYS